MKAVSAERERLLVRLDGVRRREQLAAALGETKARLAEKEAELIRCREALEKRRDDGKEIERAVQTIAGIAAQLPLYDELKEKTEEISKCSALAERYARAEESAIKERESLLIRIEAQKKEAEGAKSAELEAVQAEAEAAALSARVGEIKRLLDEIKTTYAEYVQYKSAAEEYTRLHALSSEAQQKYSQANCAFLNAQAGIIAKELREGEPCPVCGSLHHPSPATAHSAPDAAELEVLKERAESAALKERTASERAGRLNGLCEARSEQIKSLAQSYVKLETPVKLREVETSLIGAYAGGNSQLEGLRRTVAELKRRVAQAEKTAGEIQAGSERAEKLASEISEARIAAGKAKSSAERLSADAEALRAKLRYKDAAEARAKIAQTEALKRSLEEGLERYKAEFSDCDKRVAELKAQADNYAAQLAAAGGEEDGAELSEKLKTADSRAEALTEELRQIHYRLQTNGKCMQDTERALKASGEVEAKYRWVKSLSDTANGTLSGKEKIMLETYVQTAYFDRVIVRANRRLLVMTNGQYELTRRRGADTYRSQSGLDMDVVDHYNGTSRSVKSLSGRETFKVRGDTVDGGRDKAGRDVCGRGLRLFRRRIAFAGNAGAWRTFAGGQACGHNFPRGGIEGKNRKTNNS